MDFPIDVMPKTNHSPKKIPETTLDKKDSFREGLRRRGRLTSGLARFQITHADGEDQDATSE